ncbi:MAG: efflux RND transporter periplasmic adaptor subunit [Lysobacterales bacterium]
MDIARPDLLKRKHQRQWIIAASAALVLAGLGLAFARMEPAAPGVARSALWVDSVERGTFERAVRGPGVLVPKEIRWIAAASSARVERILVKPGAAVAADTLIVELSNPEVQDALLAARAALTAAEADYAARRMTLKSAELDQRAERVQSDGEYEAARLQAEAEAALNRKGIVSDINYRRSQLTAESLKVRSEIERERADMFARTVAAQLSADRARIAQLQNTLALRQRQAEGLAVRAGIAGVLQQVPVQEGQQIAIGANLARVAVPDVLIAELRIAETQAKDLRLGLPVVVDTRNGIVPGRLVRIDPAVVDGSVQVDVELDGALPPGARPDLSVDGTITIETIEDAIHVGRPAYAGSEGEISLFRIDPQGGVARRVPVRLGRASVNRVEVLKGLNVGDQVILSDTSPWDAYDRLRLE